MNIELIKTLFTFSIAIIVVIGGGLLIAIYGNLMDKLVVGAIIGFIGMALNWVFGETTRSSTARQTTRALMTTAPAATNGVTYTATTETGDVSVSPEPPKEKQP